MRILKQAISTSTADKNMFSKDNFSLFLVFFTIILSLSGRIPISFPLLFSGSFSRARDNANVKAKRVCEQIGATDYKYLSSVETP